MALRSRSSAPRAAASLGVAVIALAIVAAIANERAGHNPAADQRPPSSAPAAMDANASPSSNARLPATSTAPRAAKRLCDAFHSVAADVDGDGIHDEAWHAFVGRQAVFVGVCTGRGLDDAIPGVGMSELLAVGDLNDDGRDEILYGGTAVAWGGYHVAVLVNPNGPLSIPRLVEVTKRVRYGDPLDLEVGQKSEDLAVAFGCEVGGKIGPVVVQVTVSSHGGSLRWIRRSYRLQSGLAIPVGRQTGTLEGTKPRLEDAQGLTHPCALRKD